MTSKEVITIINKEIEPLTSSQRKTINNIILANDDFQKSIVSIAHYLKRDASKLFEVLKG